MSVTCALESILIISDVNECLHSPCENGGSCENGIGSYSCLCPVQWSGMHCDKGQQLRQVRVDVSKSLVCNLYTDILLL